MPTKKTPSKKKVAGLSGDQVVVRLEALPGLSDAYDLNDDSIWTSAITSVGCLRMAVGDVASKSTKKKKVVIAFSLLAGPSLDWLLDHMSNSVVVERPGDDVIRNAVLSFAERVRAVAPRRSRARKSPNIDSELRDARGATTKEAKP